MSVPLMRHQERVFEWLYPLTCQQAERFISRDLDGRLSRSERKLLRLHLQSCPHCARVERLHLDSRAALRSFELVRVPDSLVISSKRPQGR
jgi:predicted anti-sigma-YlaC factor YlaD